VIEVEVFGTARGPGAPARREIERLCAGALAAVGIEDGHVAVQFVTPARIAELNSRHRGHTGATDVLSFPIDAGEDVPGPRELGDIVVCPEHTFDLRQAVVHGALHLAGMDHETDDGEMLALQDKLLTTGLSDAAPRRRRVHAPPRRGARG
jgi:probable rRNA maturation factor